MLIIFLGGINMKSVFAVIIVISNLFFVELSFSNELNKEDFAGTWYGVIESEYYNYSYKTELTFYENGKYTESSGRLMPSIYPDTQTWDIDYENGRMQFKYLKIVYAGRKTYQYFYYDIVKFDDNYLELHYNFWNDPEPSPGIQKIVLHRNETTNVVEENLNKNKELLRVIDIFGREIELNEVKTSKPLFFQYNDGTVEKRYIVK